MQEDFDCCLCEETGLPGKWDAEYDKCLCECCCDPAGGPVDDTCQLKSTEVKLVSTCFLFTSSK